MDIGFFLTGLLTGLREGVEAALIVSIILAYLAKTGNQRHFGRIWFGAGAAVVVSVVVGLVLFVTIGGFEEPAEQIFEGFAMLLAAGVVTWMLFWMRRTAANIKGELQAGVDRALTEGGILGLSLLAFTAVIREGIETALFLMGQATAAGNEAWSTLIGAIVGLLIAVAIGYGLYRGAQVINLRTFFQWTGIALIFIAAGLLSHGIHEFVEAGWITIGTGHRLRHRRHPAARVDAGERCAGGHRLHPARAGRLHQLARVDHVPVVADLRGRRALPLHPAAAPGDAAEDPGADRRRRLKAL